MSTWIKQVASLIDTRIILWWQHTLVLFGCTKGVHTWCKMKVGTSLYTRVCKRCTYCFCTPFVYILQSPQIADARNNHHSLFAEQWHCGCLRISIAQGDHTKKNFCCSFLLYYAHPHPPPSYPSSRLLPPTLSLHFSSTLHLSFVQTVTTKNVHGINEKIN